MAEAAHTLDDPKLKGLILQATGLESNSKTVGAILGSFKALKAFADPNVPDRPDQAQPDEEERHPGGAGGMPPGLSLGYTINLHLPATSDVAVFNAIFRSLREHLLVR